MGFSLCELDEVDGSVSVLGAVDIVYMRGTAIWPVTFCR